MIIQNSLPHCMLHGFLKHVTPVFFICCFALAGHSQQVTKMPPLIFDSAQIPAFFKKYPYVKKYTTQTLNFYRNRNYAYAWFKNGGLVEQAGQLSARMLNLQAEGLFNKIPYQKALDSLLLAINSKPTSQGPDLTFELLLTSQYFLFAELAWQGMSTNASDAVKWHLPRKKVAYDQYLNNILAALPASLPLGEPVYRQYELLRKYLALYRTLDATENWQPIVTGSKPLAPGDSSLAVALIKRRLFKLGDYSDDTLNNSFNIAMFMALRAFQERHGLKIDGLPNKETMAELNVPLKARIQQLTVNMERSRWLPVFVNTDYVAVNIPEFKLHVYHADSLLWNCNVVVGKTVHQTSVFYGEIKYIVFSPYWNVPKSIVKHEILPAINRNRGYIKAHNMEITGYEGGLPEIRQKPGPTNSLGLVKFLFPNNYNTYLHDTPTKSLFGETTRAFSHGCIRIAEPAKMANFLLKDSKEWDSTKIDRSMHRGVEQTVTLTNTVPVFIAYFTAFVDRNNKLNFRKDIYHLDDHVAALLTSGNGVY